jgi:hypothetical protein
VVTVGTAAAASSSGFDPTAPDWLGDNLKWYRGRCVKVHGGKEQGLFDVVYDDGSKE